MIHDVIMRKRPRNGAHRIVRSNYVGILNIIMRKKHGGGKKQRDFRIGFPHPTVSKEATPLGERLKPMFAGRLPLSNS
jgi:hypothetical protein